MNGGVQFPLAPAGFDPAHHEAVSALVLLHLSEHWFDRLAAQPIKGAAGFGPQLAVHALACRQVFGHSAARRWGLAQGGALLVVFLGGNQQRAVRRLGGGIGVRPVAGVASTVPSVASSPTTASTIDCVWLSIGCSCCTSLAWVVSSAATMIWSAVTTAWPLYLEPNPGVSS